MTISQFDGPAIIVGYAYKLQIEADDALFPVGSTFRAQVRSRVTADDVLADLTTGAGLTRVSDTNLDIELPALATAEMKPGSVVMDVVRTDTAPEQHLNFFLEIPVMIPVTRP